MAVAGLLKLPVTGGSDAHSVHGLGKFLTEFFYRLRAGCSPFQHPAKLPRFAP